MSSIEEMRDQIGKWFGQAACSAGVARIYAELRIELEKQLEESFEDDEEYEW